MGFERVIEHTKLINKEVAGVIDHADLSITNEKIAGKTIDLVEKAEEVTITKHIVIPSSNLGRPPTNPPVVDIYGTCHVLEFTVNTDKAYYKFHIPEDWVPGTNMTAHVHWTRSGTGSDESGKTVKWQMRNLNIDGNSENVNSGESTQSVQDTYDSALTPDQIAYRTGEMTIPASVIGPEDLIILELMAVTPTGTALSEPACVALGFTYTAHQVSRP